MINFTDNFMFDSLDADVRAAIKGAICSRGQRKGLLKKSPPAHNTHAYAAWQGIMLSLNKQRISMGGLIMMDDRQREIFDEVDKYATTLYHCVNETLQNPFEFNLYHYAEYQEAAEKVEAESRIYGRNAKQLKLFK